MNENYNKIPKQRSRWALLGLNLIIMLLVAIGLGWIALTWLDIWTGHGDEIVVPDVKGLSYVEAENKLVTDGFTVEISDSVYDSHVRPGYVVDQNPRRNTRVKPGRMIYLTINAFTPKSVTIPRLTDMSSRQARAILAGIGIKNITEESVVSEFKDLVLGVRCDDRHLQAGARVKISSHIVLEVGDGMFGSEISADSIGKNTSEPTERLDLF